MGEALWNLPQHPFRLSCGEYFSLLCRCALGALEPRIVCRRDSGVYVVADVLVGNGLRDEAAQPPVETQELVFVLRAGQLVENLFRLAVERVLTGHAFT